MATRSTIFVSSSCEINWLKELSRPFAPHFHANALLGHMTEGARELSLNGRECIIDPGHFVIIPAWTAHSCRAVDDRSSSWLCLRLKPEVAPFLAPCVIDGEAGAHLSQCLDKLARNASQSGRLRYEPLLARICAIQSERGVRPRADQAYAGSDLAIISRALSGNLNARISLERLANIFHLDKFALIRRLRASLGVTPRQCVVSLRLIEAQQMLASGASLADCAQAAGFYDQSHFTRVFSAAIGSTPGAWRAARGSLI